MILIDANLLLYDPQSEHHTAGKAWLEATLSGSQLVRLAWMTVWAFLRISTNTRVYERPLSIAEAEDAVSAWLTQPVVGILDPVSGTGRFCGGSRRMDRRSDLL